MRRLHHVGERHRAVVAQQPHPGVEGAGHDGGEQAGAGDQVEPEAPIMRDRRRARRARPGRRSRDAPVLRACRAGSAPRRRARSDAARPPAARSRPRPPRRRRCRRVRGSPCRPAMASQWVEATTPNVPRISGRVVNMMKLFVWRALDRKASASRPLMTTPEPILAPDIVSNQASAAIGPETAAREAPADPCRGGALPHRGDNSGRGLPAAAAPVSSRPHARRSPD